MEYRDYMVRATAENAQIRAFAATTKDLAEYGRKAHGLSPIAAAALGRLMTGTVMMGQMMDNDSDMITVKMDGDGPLKSVLATADNKGNVKGYVSNPYVIMEPNAAGHLNVGGGIGEAICWSGSSLFRRSCRGPHILFHQIGADSFICRPWCSR